MIRNRWMIPAAFGALCLVLAVCSVALSKDGEVRAMEENFKIGESHSWGGLALEADKRYTLKLRPASGVPLGREVVATATLLNDDTPVFEMEDAYWHQRGTWREGGESGTWEEQNIESDFSFLVPETGDYELEVTLNSVTAVPGERLEAVLVWRQPWVLSAWPLLAGAFGLFGLAGFAHTSRRRAMARFLEELGEGSRLRLGDDEFEVVTRMEHWEGRERVGIEFRLRSKLGVERWLAVDRFEREHPYMEDQDQIIPQILIDVPLTPAMQAELERQSQKDMHIALQGQAFWRDRENGGPGQLVTVRDGTAYCTGYLVDVYRDEQRFPLNPGDRWLECAQWRDTGEFEWALMKIVESDEIDVLTIKAATQMTYAEIFERGQPSTDPFGVAQLRGSRPQQQQSQQQNQQQNQPQDWNA